ncbi:hypothetical protein VP01_100g1 [Puccinia sorghi]|uniref:Uncharacterized protein n=1 Tax=Puccinia sorghi TaxID=27349 RepID=A0A0L6VVG9_9BASI|nr:hypothetical protein VP01_100g1 [Puccinia sorghi]
MSNLLCLGQFIIPLYCPTLISLPEFHQVAFLQRGHRRVHVWCSPRRLFGDLSPLESEFIGPLLASFLSIFTVKMPDPPETSSNPSPAIPDKQRIS